MSTWILRIALAAVFLAQGADKFSGSRLWLRVFENIGFGEWFRFFTGIVEVAGALMLLVPRAHLMGVALLVCTMIGALLVHALVMGFGRQTVFVAVLLVMLFTVGVKSLTSKQPKDVRV